MPDMLTLRALKGGASSPNEQHRCHCGRTPGSGGARSAGHACPARIYPAGGAGTRCGTSTCPHTNTDRGRPKRGKTLSLLDRLCHHETETLRFLHDPHVPWSNNQAEQDIRPAKTLLKIIGGFRTEAGAQEFCVIRSYLSTTGKNNVHPFDAISMALAGQPWLPPAPAKGASWREQVAA